MSDRPPPGLAERALLIAYDVEKKKMTGQNRNRLVQAAALQHLLDAGLLTDENGRARAGANRSGNPVLDALLERIAGSKPRRWQHWIDRKAGATYLGVAQQLAAAGVVRLEARRLLGIFPRVDISVRDTRVVRELVAGARRVVLDGTPAERLDARDLAMVPLVAATELNTVFSGRERRAHRDRIRALTGPVAVALRKSVEASQASSAAV